MKTIEQKVKEFSVFALLVFTDEESVENYELPAVLDPILSK